MALSFLVLTWLLACFMLRVPMKTPEFKAWCWTVEGTRETDLIFIIMGLFNGAKETLSLFDPWRTEEILKTGKVDLRCKR